MKISFPATESKYPKLLYGDNEARYSSMTSIAFIDVNLFACSSYCMHLLYLVSFDLTKNSYKILDTLKTNGPTDLMCYRCGLLLLSNFTACSVSLYKVVDNIKLQHLKNITNSFCGPCHGVSFYVGDPTIILFSTSGTKNQNCGIYAMKMDDGAPFFALQEKGWLAKDVTVIDAKKMVGLFCASAPNERERRYYDSKIVLYEIDLLNNKSRKLDELLVPRHHGDSCVYKFDKLYVTLQAADGGIDGHVAIYNVTNNKINHEKCISGFIFPHGVDIDSSNELIAVTEYGDSRVQILKKK